MSWFWAIVESYVLQERLELVVFVRETNACMMTAWVMMGGGVFVGVYNTCQLIDQILRYSSEVTHMEYRLASMVRPFVDPS